jgi:hypothetical protein
MVLVRTTNVRASCMAIGFQEQSERDTQGSICIGLVYNSLRLEPLTHPDEVRASRANMVAALARCAGSIWPRSNQHLNCLPSGQYSNNARGLQELALARWWHRADASSGGNCELRRCQRSRPRSNAAHERGGGGEETKEEGGVGSG